MRNWDYHQLEKEIFKKKSEVEKVILSDKKSERSVRRKPRDEDERAILDQICINKWKEAERAGKIKYINKNEWYYEV